MTGTRGGALPARRPARSPGSTALAALRSDTARSVLRCLLGCALTALNAGADRSTTRPRSGSGTQLRRRAVDDSQRRPRCPD